jgi:hypothetical protein
MRRRVPKIDHPIFGMPPSHPRDAPIHLEDLRIDLEDAPDHPEDLLIDLEDVPGLPEELRIHLEDATLGVGAPATAGVN